MIILMIIMIIIIIIIMIIIMMIAIIITMIIIIMIIATASGQGRGRAWETYAPLILVVCINSISIHNIHIYTTEAYNINNGSLIHIHTN